MHEDATSMSVPGSVATSTSQTSDIASGSTADVDPIATDNNSTSDNVELQVSYSSNSAGMNSKQ